MGGDGNINNDDKNDTFVGAPYFDNLSVIDAGRAYIHCIPEYSDYILPVLLVMIVRIRITRFYLFLQVVGAITTTNSPLIVFSLILSFISLYCLFSIENI